MPNQAYFVYEIRSTKTTKSYIGISNDPVNRFRQHKAQSRRGSTTAIHAAMRKYGVDTFSVTIIQETESKAEAFLAEVELIRVHNTLCPNGYNIMKGGEGGGGTEHSNVMKRVRAAETPATKQARIKKLQEAGRNISDETRQKRSEAAKRQHSDPESKQKHTTAAAKANQDPEKRKKIAEAARIRWADPEFKAKMQAKYATDEQREKKRKASLTRWAA